MKKQKAGDTIQNLIVVSDLHCGCKLGLCPPAGIALDDGGRYTASEPQKTVWEWWCQFWDEWVPEVTKGEAFDVVVNGDAIDGVHHNSTTQISHNLADQEELAFAVLSPVRALCRKMYIVRGTEAHVGKSATDEERLARRLQCERGKHGQYTRWELWKRVGNGVVHLLHHIGTTGSAAHEASAVNAEMSAEFVEAARWGERPPDIIVRSHRHRAIEVRIPTRHSFASAVVTPGWQLKTPFSWKIAGARLAPPQFGGLLIRQSERLLYAEFKTWHITRAEPE